MLTPEVHETGASHARHIAPFRRDARLRAELIASPVGHRRKVAREVTGPCRQCDGPAGYCDCPLSA